MKMTITETPRLIIRKLNTNDAAFILTLTNEPSFIANIGDKGIRDLAAAERFIRVGVWTNQPRPGYGQFGVALKQSGELIGICGLLFRQNLGLTDIGYALLPSYWGQGYAFEAAEAVLAYGRSTLGLTQIVGLTSKDNIASIRLLQKLGMVFERTVTLSAANPETALYS